MHASDACTKKVSWKPETIISPCTAAAGEKLRGCTSHVKGPETIW